MIMHPHCKILISTDLFKVGDCQLCNNTSGIIFHRSYSFMTKSWDTRIKINNKRDFFHVLYIYMLPKRYMNRLLILLCQMEGFKLLKIM